ncbi:MAG: hypothetical protein U1E65_00680 [Myxococcota bacterium]
MSGATESKLRRTLQLFAIMSCCALTGLAVLSGVSLNACSPGNCAPGRDPDVPVSTIECPSGSVCYRGSCMPACVAGAERLTRCKADNDCTSPVQPYCVNFGGTDLFCSACPTGSVCLPDLNICGRTNVRETGDAGPVEVSVTTANPPLDAGAIDGSIFRFDGGKVAPPPSLPTTHIGGLDLAIVEKPYLGTTVGSTLTVEVLDVRGSTITGGNIVNLCFLNDLPSQPCDLNVDNSEYRVTQNEVFEGAIPADIGDLTITGVADALRNIVYHAQFATLPTRHYQVRPDIMHPVYTFATFDPLSNTLTPRSFDVQGSAKPMVTAVWPNPRVQIVIPDALVLSPNTLDLLQTVIDAGSGQALTFSWSKGNQAPSPGMRVKLRIVGPTYTFTALSDLAETDARFTLPRVLLDVLRSDPGLPAEGSGNRTVALYLERSGGQKLQAAEVAASRIQIDFKVEVRHTFVGRIHL